MSRNDDKMSQSDETRTLSEGRSCLENACRQASSTRDVWRPGPTADKTVCNFDTANAVLGHPTGIARLCYNLCCRIVTGTAVTEGRGTSGDAARSSCPRLGQKDPGGGDRRHRGRNVAPRIIECRSCQIAPGNGLHALESRVHGHRRRRDVPHKRSYRFRWSTSE